MSNPAITTRFIILSAQRSGSTALTSALHSHPDVYCHGNPFYQSAQRIAALRPEARAAMDYTERANDPVRYAYRVLNFTPGPPVVGFKIWPHSDEDTGPRQAIDAICADPTVKKIILHRSNELACHSSEVLANLKRNDPDAFGGDGPRPQARFNKMGFLKFFNRRKGWFDHYRKSTEDDTLEVPYVGLMDTSIGRISDALGLASHAFQARNAKRNSNDILNSYLTEDHDKIMRTLDEIGHPEWVTEA